MSRRRALILSALIAVAPATTAARAQQSVAPLGGSQPLGGAGDASAAASDDEAARRTAADALAGGDYGRDEQRPPSLAGGDYGRDERTEAEPASPGSTSLGDPLSTPPGGPRLRRLRRTSPADDAYAPLGVKAGAFLIRPSIETAGGYDDNADRLPRGERKGSRFYRLRGGIDATSDWSRHELNLRADGQIRKYLDKDESGYEPNFNASATGRVDVTDRTKINAELRSAIVASKRGDPDTPTNLKGDEIEKSVGATLGVTQTFNRFSLRLEGLVDRYMFDDGETNDGEKVDNSDRVYNSYEARLRGSYELSPRLQPFAEVAAVTREYDKKFGDGETVDPQAPQDRRRLGSDGYALRTGARFEMTRLVTGEAAIGYGRQTPKDKRLDAAEGLLLDGVVEWAPTELTKVRANARTSFEETTLNGSGQVLRRTVGAEVEHFLRRNWSVTARASYDRASYKGIGRIDDGLTFALESEYRLNRSVALIGSFQHERLKSSEPRESYHASIIEFGLRFRR